MQIDVLDNPPTEEQINLQIASYLQENSRVVALHKVKFRKGLAAMGFWAVVAAGYSVALRPAVGHLLDLPIMLTIVSIMVCILIYGRTITSARNTIVEENLTAIRELQPCSFSDGLSSIARRNSVVQSYIEKLALMNRIMTTKEYMALYYFGEQYTHYVANGEAVSVLPSTINTPVACELESVSNHAGQPVKRKISIS